MKKQVTENGNGMMSILQSGHSQVAGYKLIDFATYMQPSYAWNWHHELLANALDDFRRGKIKRLMVFMPPQHGKSEFTSRLFPAFCLGHNPDEQIILGSYSASLAESMNRDVQKYMDTDEYKVLFAGTALPAKGATGKYVRRAGRIDIAGRQGYFKTVGVGGSLTGTPADKLIIDDPHKDRESARNPLLSQKVYEWYTDVAKTRLHNDSGILLIQTRWDSDDLAGRLLRRAEQAIEEGEPGADIWTVISLPAIKETNDDAQDSRAIGEALWPERHSLSRLNAIRAESLRTFQSLYQQNPMPVQAGGECYKNFDYNRNTGDCAYNPDLPLHLSFDFNVNPYMSCTVWQILEIPNSKFQNPKGNSKEENPKSKEKFQRENSKFQNPSLKIPNSNKGNINSGDYTDVRAAVLVEEICMRSPGNTTGGICRYIRDKYEGQHRSTAYIYGDPNGMKQDTRQEKGHNDYAIIKQELAGLHPSLRIEKSAPSVHLRIAFMNALFANAVPGMELCIDKKCGNTIADFLYIKEKSDGTKYKQKAIDPVTGITAEKYGHMSDTAEYFICTAFADKYNQFQRGGAKGKMVVGKRRSMYEH